MKIESITTVAPGLKHENEHGFIVAIFRPYVLLELGITGLNSVVDINQVAAVKIGGIWFELPRDPETAVSLQYEFETEKFVGAKTPLCPRELSQSLKEAPGKATATSNRNRRRNAAAKTTRRASDS